MKNTEIMEQLQVVSLSDQIKECRNKIGISFTNNQHRGCQILCIDKNYLLFKSFIDRLFCCLTTVCQQIVFLNHLCTVHGDTVSLICRPVQYSVRVSGC